MTDLVALLTLLAAFIFLFGVLIEAIQNQRRGLYDARFRNYMKDATKENRRPNSNKDI